MRSARDFAVGGIRPYHAPDRPRIADPVRRRLIEGYLAGGTPVAKHWRTDGVWVWPAKFIDDIRDRGLAPEPDFIRYMEQREFRAATPPRDEQLEREARTAARAGPPRRPAVVATYYVRVDDEFPPDAPLSLLRRLRRPDGKMAEEAVWRDLAWHPTHTFASHSGDYDLREVSEAHAAAVMDHWCAKWHAEWR